MKNCYYFLLLTLLYACSQNEAPSQTEETYWSTPGIVGNKITDESKSLDCNCSFVFGDFVTSNPTGDNVPWSLCGSEDEKGTVQDPTFMGDFDLDGEITYCDYLAIYETYLEFDLDGDGVLCGADFNMKCAYCEAFQFDVDLQCAEPCWTACEGVRWFNLWGVANVYPGPVYSPGADMTFQVGITKDDICCMFNVCANEGLFIESECADVDKLLEINVFCAK